MSPEIYIIGVKKKIRTYLQVEVSKGCGTQLGNIQMVQSKMK